MAKYKVLQNFKSEFLTGKMKFFERGSFFKTTTQRPSTIMELKSRLRLSFIRELVNEKPAKKIENIDKKEEKPSKKKRS